MKMGTNVEWWEKLLENLPDSYENWFIKEEIYLRQNISKGVKVLEIGCGGGRSLNYVKDIASELWG